MKAFSPYVRQLHSLLNGLTPPRMSEGEQQQVRAILDGEPGEFLRNAVPLEARRAAGAFFTGSDMAAKVLPATALRGLSKARILDPACGVGDLLIRCARFIPVRKTLPETLEFWGTRLSGYDLQAEFISATRARLVLMAIERGVKFDGRALPPLNTLFPDIRVGDGLSALSSTGATHIVMNPPFTLSEAPKGTDWASGMITKAATFMATAVANAPAGAKIVAILPDVLRSGSRYLHWRRFIERHAKVESVDVLGQFDPHADVDVFAMSAHVRVPANWNVTSRPSTTAIENLFSVYVGPVVPFRDPYRGPRRAYITVPMLKAWGVHDAAGRYRKYAKRTFKPPFVAVRRTSRPNDRFRAVGTIIVGSRRVAVENHLLVLVPHDGTLARCRELLKLLQSPQTNEWLNQRIRCRHLTVTALRDLPWQGKR